MKDPSKLDQIRAMRERQAAQMRPKSVSPSVRAILEETSQKYAEALKSLAAGPEPKPVSATHEPPPAKFDRTAYQREYMRKRRAAQKPQ